MQVNSAALPGRADQDLLNRPLEPQVVIGDHELDAGEPSRPKALQELGPEDLVLGVADLDPEDLAVAVPRDSHGDDTGPRDHPLADATLDVGGVQEDVGVGGGREIAGAELVELNVHLRTDPRDLGL